MFVEGTPASAPAAPVTTPTPAQETAVQPIAQQTSVVQAPVTQVPVEQWYNTLPEDLKANPNITKFQSIEELAKGHVNAMSLIGRDKIPMPKTDQEFLDTMRRLGTPESADAYKLGSETGAAFMATEAEQFVEATSADFKKDFKARAHEFGMTQKQAENAYSWYIGQIHGANQQNNAQIATEMQNCGAALKAAWGEAMPAHLAVAGAAMNKVFGPETARKIEESGLGRDAKFVMAMHEIGSRSLEELGIDKRGNSTRTPAELQGEINQLMAHPGYADKRHPEHKAVVARVTALFQRQYPESAS